MKQKTNEREQQFKRIFLANLYITEHTVKTFLKCENFSDIEKSKIEYVLKILNKLIESIKEQENKEFFDMNDDFGEAGF